MIDTKDEFKFCAKHKIHYTLWCVPCSVDQLEGKKVEGTKFDADKPRMELLSTIALLEIAKVMTHGAKKYDAHNWRKGIAWSRIIGAAYRHLAAFNGGEDLDPESGISHLAHLGCCIQFLLEYQITHKELDDRHASNKKE